MSKKTRERFYLKKKYFKLLEETGNSVRKQINSIIKSQMFEIYPSMQTNLLTRFKSAKIQLRPAQIRLSYNLFQEDNLDEIISICSAIALKETFYYCLDDLFDTKISQEKIPLLGFPFYSMSYKLLSESGEKLSKEQLCLINNEFYKLDYLNGQGIMLEKKLNKDSEEKYFVKAYAYNFWEQALRIGAILGNTTKQNINLMGEVGKYIGTGIIIANDTWDFGKDEMEDFQSGKYTLPIIWLENNLKSKEKEIFTRYFGQTTLTNLQKDTVREIVANSGAIEFGKNKAYESCKKGIKLLGQFPKSEARELLKIPINMTQKNKYFKRLEEYKIK